MTPGKMLELSWNGNVENGTYDQLMVNWWFGGWWFGIQTEYP